MIGGLILQECLNRDDVGSVTAIVRRPLGVTHAKLVEVVHEDFMDYSKIEDSLKGQDMCFYCIGVYTGQVPAAEFKKITVDITKAFADALKKNSPDVSFCFLSGQGADQTEKSRLLFAREKGIAENYLQQKQFKHLYIFRPGYIYPVTPRKEPNTMYAMLRAIYKPMSKIFRGIGVDSDMLAHKMVVAGMSGEGSGIYEMKEIIK